MGTPNPRRNRIRLSDEALGRNIPFILGELDLKLSGFYQRPPPRKSRPRAELKETNEPH